MTRSTSPNGERSNACWPRVSPWRRTPCSACWQPRNGGRRNSSQLYPFIRLAVEKLDEQERIQLIEMMWEVAYADGVLDPDEDALLRRVAGLLYISDRDRGEARKRVLRRLCVTKQNAQAKETPQGKEGS